MSGRLPVGPQPNPRVRAKGKDRTKEKKGEPRMHAFAGGRSVLAALCRPTSQCSFATQAIGVHWSGWDYLTWNGSMFGHSIHMETLAKVDFA